METTLFGIIKQNGGNWSLVFEKDSDVPITLLDGMPVDALCTAFREGFRLIHAGGVAAFQPFENQYVRLTGTPEVPACAGVAPFIAVTSIAIARIKDVELTGVVSVDKREMLGIIATSENARRFTGQTVLLTSGNLAILMNGDITRHAGKRAILKGGLFKNFRSKDPKNEWMMMVESIEEAK
jgi:hypothetical protein